MARAPTAAELETKHAIEANFRRIVEDVLKSKNYSQGAPSQDFLAELEKYKQEINGRLATLTDMDLSSGKSAHEALKKEKELEQKLKSYATKEEVDKLREDYTGLLKRFNDILAKVEE